MATNLVLGVHIVNIQRDFTTNFAFYFFVVAYKSTSRSYLGTVNARYNGIRYNGNLAIAEKPRRFHTNYIQITESLVIIA